MPNQHTLTLPLAQATDRQILTALYQRMSDRLDALTNELTHHTDRTETHMSQITAALDHLADDVATEISDMQARITDMQTQLADLRTEDAGTKAALTEALTQLQQGAASIEAMASELDANDAPATQPDPATPEQPTEPVEPETPAEPTDPTAPVEQPTEPTPDTGVNPFNPNA